MALGLSWTDWTLLNSSMVVAMHTEYSRNNSRNNFSNVSGHYINLEIAA